MPNDEQLKWATSRRIVAALAADGDLHERARPVDHEMHFPSIEAADVFLAAANLRGYECTQRPELHNDHGSAQAPFLFVVQRVDRVDLKHIHRVVMDLTELAAPYDGDHVGWGCTVARG